MTLLRRELVGSDSRWAAVNAAGGLFVADRDVDLDTVRGQVLDGRVRALEVHAADLDSLQGLPLEYLFVVGVAADAAVVNTMTNLRGLSLDRLTGSLSLSRLPNLEWFGIVESAAGQLEQLLRDGHSRLRWLSVGKYREPSLSALAGLPQLTHLSVINSRSLASLAGIGRLPRLRALELAICPKLDALDGIDRTPTLQKLVLDTCNRIENLDPLASVAHLRVLQIEMRSPPSLGPLVGHSTLEFVWLVGGKRPAGEIETLLENPRLRMVNVRRATWMRTDDEWIHFDNVYAMTGSQLHLYEELIDEVNRARYC